MDQLMQANLQIIDLLGAVFEEVERQGAATFRGHERPVRLRAWVGRPSPDRIVALPSTAAMN